MKPCRQTKTVTYSCASCFEEYLLSMHLEVQQCGVITQVPIGLAEVEVSQRSAAVITCAAASLMNSDITTGSNSMRDFLHGD